MKKALAKIQEKLSTGDLLNKIDDQLSLSELNTLLLHLFRNRTKRITPAQLLQRFQRNRFVRPANIDAIGLMELQLQWLKYAQQFGFHPLLLSPVTPLGTSSVVGPVDQNNVLSSIRGTEVVSDSTNVLALKIADDFKNRNRKEETIKYSTVHRHVRGQYFDNPMFSAHFSVYGMATGSLDRGNFGFEIEQLSEHLSIIHYLLSTHFSDDRLIIRIYPKKNSTLLVEKMKERKDAIWNAKNVEYLEEYEHNYYQTIRFKIFLKHSDQEIDMADGGLVDWTQKLLSNKKHRLFISGVGTEMVMKIST